MRIGGLRKLSLIDYPGEISTVIFTTGCNFRCIYCHNSHLVLPELFPVDIKEDAIIEFLETRIGKISAVVISGGEPTLHNDLPAFITRIKNLGFKIKLDTNGTQPDALLKLINAGLLDFIAMDVKASTGNYDTVCGVNADIEKINNSIEIIRNSSVPHQFRTTLIKGYHTGEEVQVIESFLTKEPVVKQYFKYEDSVLDKKLSSANEFKI
jgi:pyruvate formate lyase activating enzyme